MTRTGLPLLLTIAALSLLAGTSGMGSAGAARAIPALPTCQNIQLLIRPHSSNGAAGHIGLIYRIHNLSQRDCFLEGYPGVQLLDRHFVSMPTTVTRGGSFIRTIPKRGVTLPAGGNAYFTLLYSDVPTGSGPCRTARNLMIFAPDNFLPVVTYAAPRGGGIAACNGAINVSPVTAHPRFR
jgi:Protein of unknown function (DUF4232)